MVARESSRAAATIAVISVSFGSAEPLRTLLESLPLASVAKTSLIVADNRPADGDLCRDITEQSGGSYLPMTRNLGYGGAVNAAARTISDSIEWILVVNPDVILRPGAIDALVRAGSGDPTVGSIGPLTLTGDGAVYPSARAVPSIRTGVGHALFANLWLGNPWTRAYRNDVTTSTTSRDAGWLSGACVLVRRTAFDELGGFDDGYFMYFEDVDLGYRLGKAGYRNVYEPAAVVVHTGAHATTSESERMIAAHHRSARRFLNRKYSAPILWPLRVALSLGLSVRSALVRRQVARQ